MSVRPHIIDATLRERGSDLTSAHRVLIAKILDELEVDAVDLGAPATFAEGEAVAECARALKHARPVVTVPPADDLAPGVELAANAMASAGVTDYVLMVAAGAKADPSFVRNAVGLAKARAHTVGVVFGDAFGGDGKDGTDVKMLLAGIEAAVWADASVVLLEDGTGAALPETVASVVAAVKAARIETTSKEELRIAVQCRNTLGLAAAGTLAAMRAGADAVVLTLAGVGEGAGCAALEEVATAMRVHGRSLGLVRE